MTETGESRPSTRQQGRQAQAVDADKDGTAGAPRYDVGVEYLYRKASVPLATHCANPPSGNLAIRAGYAKGRSDLTKAGTSDN